MNETMTNFGYPELNLFEYEHWIVQLRKNQVTIGSLVAIAKSGATNLGALTSEEWAEFSQVCADLEQLLMSVFNAEKFNYLALMMVDPNVHFHIIPRYSVPVEFNSQKYEDPCWPGPTDLQTIEVTDDELESIFVALKEKL